MNSHERLQSELIDLVHRELSPWRALRVRLHLSHCTDCRAEKQRLETLWSSLQTLHSPKRLGSRLKGNAMQARVLLASVCLFFCFLEGALLLRGRTPRTLQHPPQPRVYAGWSFWGQARGKVVFLSPGSSLADANVQNTNMYEGLGRSQTIHLKMPQSLANQLSPPNSVNFTLNLGEKRELRNHDGKLFLTVVFIPFTKEEEQQFHNKEAAQKQRLLALYNDPRCFTFTQASLQPGGQGVSATNELIVWMTAVLHNDQGGVLFDRDRRPIPLESGGYAWKVLGRTKVTMSLYTDPKYKPLVRHYASLAAPRDSHKLPKRLSPSASPRIYWSQSAPNTASYQPVGQLKQGDYGVNVQGGWLKVARSGEFSGFGRHVVNGPDGKPQLILEVSPL